MLHIATACFEGLGTLCWLKSHSYELLHFFIILLNTWKRVTIVVRS